MALTPLFLFFLFQQSTFLQQAREEIIKYYDRFYTQMIESAKTGEMLPLLNFDEDFDTTGFKKAILEYGKKKSIAEMDSMKKIVLSALKQVGLEDKGGCCVEIKSPYGNTNFYFHYSENDRLILHSIESAQLGRRIRIKSYLTPEEKEAERKAMIEFAKNYDPSHFGDEDEPKHEQQEQTISSPLEFSVEEEYTRIIYARELWEAEGLKIPNEMEEELESKYFKVWVLKLTVRGTSSEQEPVSFEILPLIDANGKRYAPVCDLDDAFWKLLNGNVEMDYAVTKQCPITRLVPYLYWTNAEGRWKEYCIPRNTIFKIGKSDTEVRSP